MKLIDGLLTDTLVSGQLYWKKGRFRKTQFLSDNSHTMNSLGWLFQRNLNKTAV